jgi:putative transposase
MLGKQLPKVEAMLRDAKVDLLAFTGFPVSHWKKIWSTNPLERLNKEVNAVPTSSASSPTPPPCSAWPAPSWSRPTTNGRSPTAATSPRPPWPCSPRQSRPPSKPDAPSPTR